jgi:Mg2+ and Co2+ transporter CorA
MERFPGLSGTLLRVDSADGTVTECELSDIPRLLADTSGWLWLDLPEPGADAGDFLVEIFGLHRQAVQDVLARNHVPRLHVYGEVLFLVLHRPETGANGHVHYLELDQFISDRFLITTHGPRNPDVPLERLLTETADAAERMRTGRFRPASPALLSYRIVSALTRMEEGFVNATARQVGELEKQVMAHAGDGRPEDFLDDLFHCRHALTTVHTMSTQSAEIYGRAIRLLRDRPRATLRAMRDLQDQYHRLSGISSSQLEFLGEVTEYYRARTDTKMTVAAERLAVIAAVTLPVTAISSVVGMNVIVNGETQWPALIVLLVVMGGMSWWLLRWAKRQGWW